MKKFRMILFVLIFMAFAAVLFCLGISFYMKKSTEGLIRTTQELLEEKRDYDCILVLGCGVRPDGSLSPMLRDRIDRAAKLYHAGAAAKILVSGDHGSLEYDEVNCMKKALIQEGVPSEDIFMDHAGFSTYESMYRGSRVFQSSSCIVVTQKYHLYRALYDARALGMTAEGVAAEDILYRGWQLRSLREVIARDKDFLYCLLKPVPKFGGDVIPITGNGDTTNDKN